MQMTYSCSDFTDTIIDALGVEVPDESNGVESAELPWTFRGLRLQYRQ
jgi:hypothetical protein